MKIKVSDTTPLQLNWLVARIEGFESFEFWHTGAVTTRYENGVTVTHSYCDNPAKGQPILERERIGTGAEGSPANPTWSASLSYSKEVEYSTGKARRFCSMRGPTMLIAGLRCYVASKLGDEVEVPDELS